jgi:CubicO group peptidase (beta-lactamase class C family)
LGRGQEKSSFCPAKGSLRRRREARGRSYDNILYNSAGALIQQISGKSWAEFIRQQLFAPLNMRDSKTSIRDIDSSTDVVAPHSLQDGKLRPLEHMPLDNNAPAGAIVSSVDDMSRWVIALLNKGDLGNGKRLFSEKQAQILWAPLTILPVDDPPPELADAKPHFVDYAMGEVLRDYRGHLLVSHTGGLQGMVSVVSMLPELHVGLVVLTNQESGAAFQSITYTVLDHYLEAPTKDWVAALSEVVKRNRNKAEQTVRDEIGKRDSSSKPSLSLNSYAACIPRS